MIIKAGSSGGAAGIVLLDSGTVSAAATLDIVLTSYTAYRGFRVLLGGWRPVTDDVNLLMRFSTNGGSSYDAGASDYKFGGVDVRSGANDNYGSTGATALFLNRDSGSVRFRNPTTDGGNVTLDLLNLTSAAFYSRATWHTIIQETSAGFSHSITGGGYRAAAQDTDAIRFLFSSGNIAEGNWALYGYA